MSTADDGELDDLAAQDTTSAPNRFAATEHTTVQDSVPKQKSTKRLAPSRTVTRYEADSSEANIEQLVDEMNPDIPERDSTNGSAGIDIFVAHD